jgi:hypothetical protein
MGNLSCTRDAASSTRSDRAVVQTAACSGVHRTLRPVSRTTPRRSRKRHELHDRDTIDHQVVCCRDTEALHNTRASIHTSCVAGRWKTTSQVQHVATRHRRNRTRHEACCFLRARLRGPLLCGAARQPISPFGPAHVHWLDQIRRLPICASMLTFWIERGPTRDSIAAPPLGS